MSRDMCRHGFNLREHPCVDCLVSRGNANEIVSMFWAMKGERDREIEAERAELAALRLIVTEKFAGADMYVKPEDAADVARWAQHPEAVRELLKHEPWRTEEFQNGLGQSCAGCGWSSDVSHGLVWISTEKRIVKPCPVAAAWRALGDPRGSADIERAWEEALRQNVRLFPQWMPRTATHGEWGIDPARPGADEQRALYGRHLYATPPFEGRIPTDADMSRLASDARGMEAVEDEARWFDMAEYPEPWPSGSVAGR